jgi:citrate synthase
MHHSPHRVLTGHICNLLYARAAASPDVPCVGIHKTKYWEPVFEDSMNLLGKLPSIAAMIYNNTYHEGRSIAADAELDWAANLAVMMGQDKSDTAALDMMRMYQTIHAGAQYCSA